MLRKIELLNFLSHGESEIALKPGITVFMGQNGSGKSSVIDAITFALFGKHTRPNNKGLVKYREAKGQASVEFTSGDKIYKAVRSLTAKGTTEAKLYKITEGKEVLTAQGERSQLGNDTMSNAIESIIGLDFDKIRISSIVQQGELEKIIKAKPKEFKELLNSIITIDKLDLANLSMKGIKEKFRSNIKEQYDYDDEDLGIVSNKITECEAIIKDSEPLLKKLQEEKTEREKRISDLKQEVDELRTQELKVEELESRKNELISYAREKIVELRRRNLEIEEKIEKCNSSFSIIDVSGNVEPEISQGKATLEKISEEFLDLSGKKSKFNANVSLAEKITLKDGKCPVCDSEVDHLNELFQIEHIKKEVKEITERMNKLEQDKREIQQKTVQLEKKLEEQRNANAVLKANNINHKSDITKLQEELDNEKKQLQVVSSSVESQQIVQLASLDAHAKQISENISRLERETEGFDQAIFSNLQSALSENENELRRIDTNYGATISRLDSAKEELEKLSSTLKELEIAREYVSRLEKIQETVYKVDGPVAKSLRSWALNTISQNASRYLEMMNTRINKIHLQEDVKKIDIICKRGNTEYDIGSLSGGERVTVAIALRLGMAHLLESSKLNFMIMDEPTNYLDAEHKAELVNVLTQLAEVKKLDSEAPLQLLIITHDTEIFENTSIDNIYRFSKNGDETRIEFQN